MLHFDLLYIGNDSIIWDYLQNIADNNDLNILNIKSTSDINLIKDDFSFTIVLTELHLDYNYEGFTVDKTGLRYSFIGLLTNEIEKSISVSNSLFNNQEKLLLFKNTEIIYSFLKSKPIQLDQNIHQTPVEA